MADVGPPFERFSQFRRYFQIGFHPSGDLLYVTDLTGQYNLWRQPVLKGGVPGYARALTNERDRAVRTFSAADDGRSILVTVDRDGDEYYQIERIWLDGQGVEPITNAPEVQHHLSDEFFPTAGNELLYLDNGRERTDMDVVVLDLGTRTETRPFPTGRFWGNAVFDPTRRRILAADFRSNTRTHTFVLDRKSKDLTELLPHDEEAVVAPVGWTHDGRGVLLLSDLGREFKQLELFDTVRRTSRVIAAPKADVEHAALARRAGVVAYAVNEQGFSTLYAGRLGRPATRLRVPRGSISTAIWGSPFAVSPDGRSLIALWSRGTAPAEILRVPIPHGSPSFVTDGMVGGVPDAPLPAPRLVRIPGPQGRPVPAFYYRPKRRPKGRMPAILAVHGGPESQERPSWRTSGLYAFLNSRGIAVLAPNIRGSIGYGKSYQREIHHDWGGGELEDLRACAEWLLKQPDLDPNRLGVFGGSFGGFAVLSCVSRLPQYWKVGVDLFGPSNLVTFAKAVPPTWRRFMAQWVGDPETEADFLMQRSPISYLDAIRADLLIIQGSKDPRVVKQESDQVVERLRAAGRSVEYLVIPDEGHGFTRKQNELTALGAVSRFLLDRLVGTPPSGSP